MAKCLCSILNCKRLFEKRKKKTRLLVHDVRDKATSTKKMMMQTLTHTGSNGCDDTNASINLDAIVSL